MKSKLLKTYLPIAFSLKQIKQLLLFAFTFGGLKLNAVSAALILSNFFPSIEEFGAIEYALSVGLLLTVVFNLGLHGAIPYYLLKQKKKDYVSVFYFHGWLLLVLFFAGLCLYLFTVGYVCSTLSLSLSIATIFSLQILASIISKSKENIYGSILLDSAFFLLLNGYNLYLYWSSAPANLSEIQALLFLQIGLLAFFYGYHFFRVRSNFSWQKYLEALRFGRPLVLGTLLIMGLTGTGRIFAEYFFDLQSVAIYGIYFRLAAIVVLVHQIVNIAYFKKLYASKTEDLDRWFELFLGLIMVLCLLSYFVIPGLAITWFSIVRDSWEDSRFLFIGLSFQMFFWIALSLFENIISREKLASDFNKKLIPLLLLMAFTFGAAHYMGFLTINLLVLINSLAIYFAIERQVHLLKQQEKPFYKTTFIIRSVAFFQFIFVIFQY